MHEKLLWQEQCTIYVEGRGRRVFHSDTRMRVRWRDWQLNKYLKSLQRATCNTITNELITREKFLRCPTLNVEALWKLNYSLWKEFAVLFINISTNFMRKTKDSEKFIFITVSTPHLCCTTFETILHLLVCYVKNFKKIIKKDFNMTSSLELLGLKCFELNFVFWCRGYTVIFMYSLTS